MNKLQRVLVSGICFALAGCQSPVEQTRLPAEHTPKISGKFFYTDTGDALPMRSWLPQGRVRAVVVALHGFNDYSKAYVPLGKFLTPKGYAVYAYDQRGFGAAMQPGIWASEDNLIGDMHAFVAAVKARHKGVPVYLIGESMGGAVLARAMAREDFPEVDAVVLSAPAVWGDDLLSAFSKASLWVWAHILPAQTLTGEDLDILATDNLAILREMGMDPLVIKETRVDSIYGLVNLMDDAAHETLEAPVPVLVLYGQQDEVVMPEPVAGFYHKVEGEKRFGCYPRGYHMLMRDLGAKVVLKDIAGWLKNPDKPLASGLETADGNCPHTNLRHRQLPQ